MATLSSKFSQVYYVRIPDPDCKEALSKCQQTLVPVEGLKAQGALWKYDNNQNNVLGADDLMSDPTMAIPQNASKKLADLLIASQQVTGNQSYFSSPESVLSWVKARLSVDRAYDTIQWLKSFRAGHVYKPTEWSQIEGRLGSSAKGYTEQVTAAARTFATAISAPEHKMRPAYSYGGFGETTHLNGVSYILDQRSFSHSMRVYMDETLHKMVEIFEFDRTGGIKSSNFSVASPSDATGLFKTDPNIRGLMIVVRMDDMFSHTPSFKYFTTQYFGNEIDANVEKFSRSYLCKDELQITCDE